MRRSPAIAAVLVVALAVPVPAFADDQGAIANTLFREGQALMKKGDFAGACAKFEGSLNLAVKPGTQFNLADCYEKAGKTAAAWDGFGKVVAMTKEDPPRYAAAKKRVDALEPKLTRLVVKVAPEARLPGLAVTRDGRPIPAAAFDMQLPVDPATYKMEATAPGYRPWTATIRAEGMGARVTVQVPRLEKAPDVVVDREPPLPPGRAREGGGGNLKVVGLVVGGVGAAVLGTSLYFALSARSKWKDAEPMCPDNVCTPNGYDLAQGARTRGNIAFVTFLIGTAAVGTGVVLFLVAPRGGRERTAVRMTPSIGPDGAGVVFSGGF